VTGRDHHAGHAEEVGAYLLGALTELERQAFERHLAGCAECRDEVERLRPAADALPRSVEQLDPPPGLKTSLMEVVEREAAEREGAPALRRPWRPALRLSFTGARVALAAGALALGVVAGFGAAQLAGDDGARTLEAAVDESRIPRGSASLRIFGDGEDGAILRVQGMPSPGGGRVYQAWVQRDGTVVPQPTFEIGEDGGGAVALPDDLSGAEAILVTRERRGGARAPSERPILSVPL
jgi:anti-sigma factor RsiW